jgi:hypothetical protein
MAYAVRAPGLENQTIGFFGTGSDVREPAFLIGQVLIKVVWQRDRSDRIIDFDARTRQVARPNTEEQKSEDCH